MTIGPKHKMKRTATLGLPRNLVTATAPIQKLIQTWNAIARNSRSTIPASKTAQTIWQINATRTMSRYDQLRTSNL